jgi:hypothetical protein
VIAIFCWIIRTGVAGFKQTRQIIYLERLPNTFAQDRDRCRTIPRAAIAEAE